MNIGWTLLKTSIGGNLIWTTSSTSANILWRTGSARLSKPPRSAPQDFDTVSESEGSLLSDSVELVNGVVTEVNEEMANFEIAMFALESVQYEYLRPEGCFFFFLAPFCLAQGLVGAVLLGSFQACAIYIPAAPDVQGSHCSLGAGWDATGGKWASGIGQHLTGERLVAVGEHAREAPRRKS